MKHLALISLLIFGLQAQAKPTGSAAGGTIGTPAGGTIGSGTGGAQGRESKIQTAGAIQFVDSQTGERVDLSIDRFAQVFTVNAYRLCNATPCLKSETMIELDGSAFSLAPGRYVFELGPSISQVIEIGENQAVTIPLAKVHRPSKIAQDRALLVIPFLQSHEQSERRQILSLTGRTGQLAGQAEDFRRTPWIIAEQTSAYVFPGRYSIGYQPYIVSLLSPFEWIHDVSVR